MPSSTLLRHTMLVILGSALLYRGFVSLSPQPIAGSSANQPLSVRVKRLLNVGGTAAYEPRSVRVTVHVFEARPTGVLPLSLPPLETAAVSRYGDRVLDIIRETAQYYDRLNALYPSAHFELLTAAEGIIAIQNSWLPIPSLSGGKSMGNGLIFPARDYTIHVTPSTLDASDWLSTQVTVERYGQFLLSNKITWPANGTPFVIGGPIEGRPQDGGRKAVFVGVTVSFVSKDAIEQARETNKLFQSHMFDTPPHLIEFAPAEYPAKAQEDGLHGMSIFLAHVGTDGRIKETLLVSSLRQDCDEAALDAIKRSRFTPATQGRKPVDAWVFMPVQYQSDRFPVTSATRPHS